MSTVVEMSPRRQIAANVKAELARKGMTARSLERELGWSYSACQRRTSGATPFDADQLIDIASLLDIPVTAFSMG